MRAERNVKMALPTHTYIESNDIDLLYKQEEECESEDGAAQSNGQQAIAK